MCKSLKERIFLFRSLNYILPLFYKDVFVSRAFKDALENSLCVATCILKQFWRYYVIQKKNHKKENGNIIILLKTFILKLHCLNIIISLIFRLLLLYKLSTTNQYHCVYITVVLLCISLNTLLFNYGLWLVLI